MQTCKLSVKGIEIGESAADKEHGWATKKTRRRCAIAKKVARMEIAQEDKATGA